MDEKDLRNLIALERDFINNRCNMDKLLLELQINQKDYEIRLIELEKNNIKESAIEKKEKEKLNSKSKIIAITGVLFGIIIGILNLLIMTGVIKI